MKTTITAFAAFATLATLAGCAAPSAPNPEAESVDGAEANLTGAQAAAGNCEVFVNRAGVSLSSHASELLTIYLKTPVSKLQAHGGVKSAGYHAQETENGKAGPFRDILASRFAGAADYWQLDFPIASSLTPARQFKGAFYVEAVDGARFWLNASEGGKDFILDENLVNNLQNLRSSGFFADSTHANPSSSIVPANEFPYLNAQRCR